MDREVLLAGEGPHSQPLAGRAGLWAAASTTRGQRMALGVRAAPQDAEGLVEV